MANPQSIAALQNALAEKRQQVAEFRTQRNDLLRQVAKLDTRIAALAGTPSDGSEIPAAHPLPRNARSLMDCVIEVLGNSSEPMTAGEIADAVTAMGYVSSSKNLKQLVWTQIYKDERVGKAGRGKFVLKSKGKAKK